MGKRLSDNEKKIRKARYQKEYTQRPEVKKRREGHYQRQEVIDYYKEYYQKNKEKKREQARQYQKKK